MFFEPLYHKRIFFTRFSTKIYENCAICTKYRKIGKNTCIFLIIISKKVLKVIHKKNGLKTIKMTYTRSYPHFPQENYVDLYQKICVNIERSFCR